jgi:hypothetical protein
MNKMLALSALALTLLPLAASAAPTHHATKAHSKMAATMYQCQKCHMKVTAAAAKKDHYKDPMDGGKLVPVTAAPTGKPMSGMKM